MTNDRTADQHTTEREQVGLLLAVALDFVLVPDDADASASNLIDWLAHIGLDCAALRHPTDLLEALPAIYRVRAGRYDVDRLERDLMSWPPVARAVVAAAQEMRVPVRKEKRV